jgi:alginate O-acetyltransferase complex protein AlgI
MVFSSLVFLYLFLPAALLGHFALPAKLRNLWLLICSLGFYAWGEGWFVLVMLAGIAFNYVAALAIEAFAVGSGSRRLVLAAAIILDLAPLIFFKYIRFLLENLHAAAAPLGWDSPVVDGIHLPIGISFFTFQGISYLIDVYRADVRAQRDPIAYGSYKSMFPQLIAGPIVRYRDVAESLDRRGVPLADIASGIERFVIGLGKKVLLADLVAIPADRAFALDPSQLTTPMAWIGCACYTLQIYLDFSAYSDMAIGLGRILGFRFPENFAYPYAAASIRDFWRRWHISLSSWFRDYLYVPLGGSRGGPARTARNLLIVFVLCGLWHGAQWTFLIWGLWHGVFLAAEHAGSRYVGRVRFPAPISTAYVIAVALVGWVFFRADSFQHAAWFLRAMAGNGAAHDGGALMASCGNDVIAAACIGCAAAFGIWPKLAGLWSRLPSDALVPWLAQAGRLGRMLCIGSASTACIIGHAYSPFIYFRF